MGLTVLGREFKDDQDRTLTFPFFSGYDKIRAKHTVQLDYSVPFTSLVSVVKSGTTLTLTSGTWENYGFVAGATLSGTYGVNSLAGTETIDYIDGAFMNVTGLTTSNDGTYDTGTIRTDSVADALTIFFNLVPNDNSNQSEFSLIDGEVNKLTAFLDGMAVNDIVDMVRLNNFSGGSYMEGTVKRIADSGVFKRYEINFQFNPWTVKLPELYEASNCVKPWLKIEAFPEFNNAGVKLTLVNTPTDANTGLSNEVGNGGIPAYTLTSCVFKNLTDVVLPSIDYSQATKFEVVIAGTFDADSKFQINIWNDPQTDTLYKNLPTSFSANTFNLQRGTAIPVGALAGIVNSSTRPDGALISLSNVVVTQSGTSATITGRITPNAEFTSEFEARQAFDRVLKLWIRCENSTLTSNLINPVWVVCSEAEATKQVIPLGEYDIKTIVGYQHDGSLIYKIFQEDDGRFITTIDLPRNNDYETISIGIVVRNFVTGETFDLEKFTTNLASFPTLPDGSKPIDFVAQRNFNLSSENLNNVVTIQRDFDEDSETEYGVIIDYGLLINWKEWLIQNNATLEFFGVNTQEWFSYQNLSHELCLRFAIETPLGTYENLNDFEVLDYDDWEGTSVFEFYTLDDEPLTQPLKNAKCKVIARHTPDVPKDELSAPWGQITVEPFEAEKRFSISSVWTMDIPNCPLIPLDGETKLKLEGDGTEVTLTCIFDPLKINVSNGVSFSSRVSLGRDTPDDDDKEKFYKNSQNRHKETFQLSTLPPVKPTDERGDDCCCKLVVMADPESNDTHKNDISSRWAFGDSVTFELYKGDVLTDFVPTTQSFPNDTNAKYCTITWKDVLENTGVGCYSIKAISDVAGLEITETVGEFELKLFDWEQADRTVRLRSVFNDANQKLGINFTNAQVVDDIRVKGDIEDFQPNTVIDNLKYSDYSMNKVKRENLTRWTLNIEPNQFCIIDRLINLHLVGENTILLSDYNATAYDKTLLDRAMILSQEGGGAQMESFRGSAKKGFQADFEEKVQDNFTAYGFIGQSGEAQPNIPLIPNVVGGACEDVTLTLNGNTFLSVPSGDTQDIELLDQNGDPITPDDVTGNVITVDVGEPCPPITSSAKPLKTALTTSYATGDDGGTQRGRATDFLTLDFINPFGNNRRFTGLTGGYHDGTTYRLVDGTASTRAGAFPNDICADWTTFQNNEVLLYYHGDAIFRGRNAHIAQYLTGTISGLTSWYVVNRQELFRLMNDQAYLNSSHFLAYPPFDYTGGTRRYIWISSGSALAGVTTDFGVIHGWSSGNAANGLNSIWCRYTTLTELGL